MIRLLEWLDPFSNREPRTLLTARLILASPFYLLSIVLAYSWIGLNVVYAWWLKVRGYDATVDGIFDSKTAHELTSKRKYH